LNKVDAYVDERKLEIERIEAASRAELEEASKRLDARCELMPDVCSGNGIKNQQQQKNQYFFVLLYSSRGRAHHTAPVAGSFESRRQSDLLLQKQRSCRHYVARL
jgi:hypothetical protein